MIASSVSKDKDVSKLDFCRGNKMVKKRGLTEVCGQPKEARVNKRPSTANPRWIFGDETEATKQVSAYSVVEFWLFVVSNIQKEKN